MIEICNIIFSLLFPVSRIQEFFPQNANIQPIVFRSCEFAYKKPRGNQ